MPGSAKHRTRSARSTVWPTAPRSEEHTSELQSRQYLVCRLLLEKKKELHTLRRETIIDIISAMISSTSLSNIISRYMRSHPSALTVHTRSEHDISLTVCPLLPAD